MKRIYVIEDLCNGCRLCETFCSSLKDGVFSSRQGRVRVLKVPGEEKDIPMVDCDGKCIRPIYDDGIPTCVRLCPTGALYYEDHDAAVEKRLFYEQARKEHSLFKILAPWKWPFPWKSEAGSPAQRGGGSG